MAAPLLAPLIKALLGILGLGSAVVAWGAKTPAEAVREVRVKRALQQGRAASPLQLPSSIVIPTDASQVAGSGDLGPLDPAAPQSALGDITALDSRWAPAVESYRALHDSRPTDAEIRDGTARVYRYPTRLAVLRATVDALYHADPFAQKYGEGYAITDPTTNELRPEWLQVVSLYDPTDADWSEVAAQVEDFYADAARPDPGVFDYLRTLLDTTTSALALDWRGALRGGVRLAGLGESDAGGASRTPPRQVAREEDALLGYLLSWTRPVQVESLRAGRRITTQPLRTAWEALSGGGTPLDRALASLGGQKEIAERLRAVPGVTEKTKALPDPALVLKAALLARRVPAAGSAFALPYSAVPKPTAAPTTRPQTPPPPPPTGTSSIRDQSQGTNSQYQGPAQ